MLICAALILAAIACTRPFAESGFNDDWSYTKTALDLAQTGKLRYNGWAAAMVGAQAYWGAAFIKLFGFSFLTTRLSTAPLAAGCAALLYALHRRASLPPILSIFGTLIITLSPLFIPHAASFMTEVPAFFLLLVSLYGYTRSCEILDDGSQDVGHSVADHRRLVGWLSFATVSGLLAGTVRQAFWILPILAPLYLAVRPMDLKRPFRAGLIVCSFLALAASVGLGLWFHAQPYAIHERIAVGFALVLDRATPLRLAARLSTIVLTLGVLTLPMLIALPLTYGKVLERSGRRVAFGAACLLLAGLLTIAELRSSATGWAFPWLPNTVTVNPYLSGSTAMPNDATPLIFTWKFWKGLSAVTITLTNLSVAAAIMTWFWRGEKKSRLINAFRHSAPPIALLVLFATAYLPLLMLKDLIAGGLIDRYLLPFLPVVTMTGLGIYYRLSGRDRLPALGWLTLFAMAYYGIAQTHDYFALLRARLKITNALENRGIPRTKILGGFEYDAWTQVTLAGHYNDSRIDNPKDACTPASPLPFETVYSLWQNTPIVRPDYFVCLSAHPDLLNTDLAPVTYPVWLPPFKRRCLVQVKDPSLAFVRSLPLASQLK
ncbi:MAG: hypothetical protein ACJ8NS_06170 [Chthoniobacterales bacterium]